MLNMFTKHMSASVRFVSIFRTESFMLMSQTVSKSIRDQQKDRYTNILFYIYIDECIGLPD